MYDIIGDIHGHAGELIALLTRLGYQRRNGYFSHSRRQAVFVGDFIDRGPRILESLAIVRRMVDSGHAQAVMGNHEFNAIAFHTEDPERPGEFFREHSEKNFHQHEATLRQVSCRVLTEYLNWFKQLPISIDLKGVRVVHACWDPDDLAAIKDARKRFGRFTVEFVREASDPQRPLYRAIERVLKGPEIRLPKGVAVPDKEGVMRRDMRIRWFEVPDGHTFASYGLPRNVKAARVNLPRSAAKIAKPYPSEEPPVFFGHYWLRARQPKPLASNVACVDYSVAKKGKLCAYRWNHGKGLNPENFAWVDAGQV